MRLELTLKIVDFHNIFICYYYNILKIIFNSEIKNENAKNNNLSLDFVNTLINSCQTLFQSVKVVFRIITFFKELLTLINT